MIAICRKEGTDQPSERKQDFGEEQERMDVLLRVQRSSLGRSSGEKREEQRHPVGR